MRIGEKRKLKLQFVEFHRRLSFLLRLFLAAGIFGAALLLRLAAFPAESGLPFLTFYPATLITFYLCGIPIGWISAVACAAAGVYFFIPPYSLAVSKEGLIAFGIYMFFSLLISMVFSQLRSRSRSLREALEKLTESEHRYQQILEDQTEIICRFRADGTIIFVNQAFCSYFGKTPKQLVGKTWQPIPLPEDLDRVHRELAAMSPQNATVEIENRVLRGNGEIRWCHFVNQGFYSPEGELLEIQSEGRDVTELATARQELSKLSREQKAILDTDLIGIAKAQDWRPVWINSGISHILGYTPDEIIGRPLGQFFSNNQAYKEFASSSIEELKRTGRYRAEILVLNKNRETVWLDLSGSLLGGDMNESIWFFKDISHVKAYQQQVERHALYDSLTALPNRRLLADRAQLALANAQRLGHMVAVCYLDLDGFKPVNDRYGHAVGDQLLIEVARRLSNSARLTDTVSRIGGDEFLLLFSNIANAGEFDKLIERVTVELQTPYVLPDGSETCVSASIGVSFFPINGIEFEILVREADQAMYRAKREGAGKIVRLAGASVSQA